MSVSSAWPHDYGVIPKPSAVRHRLAEVATELQILRRLLRVADDAAEERHRLIDSAPAPAPAERQADVQAAGA
jgi:hypothetical protein